MNLRELYANAFYKDKNGFLLHGDCVDRLKEIDDESVDLIVTSPPYDDLRTYKEGYSFDFENVAKELLRITKTGGGLRMDSGRCNKGWVRVANFV